jgi:glycosyltransferase involved in cell wall biosynthesis
VATIHDVNPVRGFGREGRFSKNHLRLLHALRVAKRIIVPSVATREAIALLEPRSIDRVRVIHHGVDKDFKPEGLPLKRDRYGLPPKTPFLLWVGTVRDRKDPLVLVKAFARISRLPEYSSLHLLMCGDLQMDESALRAPLRDHDAQARFRLHGYAAREDLPDLYREAEAVVIPSQLEGFGLPALEAMACGTPLVTSTDPALRELVGSAALAFPIGDDEALAATLKRLLSTPEERVRLRERAKDRAQGFCWSATAAAHADVYREVLGI